MHGERHYIDASWLLDIHGYRFPLIPTEINEFPRRTMEINRYPKISMCIDGYLWIPTEVYGHQRISMVTKDTHGDRIHAKVSTDINGLC